MQIQMHIGVMSSLEYNRLEDSTMVMESTRGERKGSQKIIILLCWLVYSLSYLGRYSYNANINLIIDNYRVSYAQAGLVTTCYFFAYAIGQFVNGFMCSRYNKKWIFPIVLFGSSLLNIIVFLGVPFVAFKYLWLINGLLQSCLWTSLICVLSNMLDSKHLNGAIFVMSTTVCSGTLITYGFSSVFVWLGNYKMAFLFGACIMTVLGFVWLIVYNPKQVQIKTEKERSAENAEKNTRMNEFIVLIVILSLFSVSHNIIKDGLSTWVPTILKERYFLKDEVSILLTLVLPVIGVFGAVMSLTMNKYIKNFVTLTATFFAIGAAVTAIITLLPDMGIAITLLCFGIVVCMMHGINNVVTSIAPLKMRGKINSGKLAGIMNGCCYVGSTVSSYGLGKIADTGGWQWVFNFLLALCIITAIIGGIYTIASHKNKNV